MSHIEIEDWEILDLLTYLVDKSMVIYEEDEQGQGRYRLLETLRQYGQERLSETEEATRQGRHLDFFLGLAEEAKPKLQGPEQTVWLDRLEREHTNLEAALQWAHDNEPEAALRLANALAWFWSNRGYYAEGEMWLAATLSNNAEASALLRAETLCALAFLAVWHDITRGKTFAEESLALARSAGHKPSMARAMCLLGFFVLYHGDTAHATALIEEGLPLSRETGDPWTLSLALAVAGWLSIEQRDYERATALFEESVAVARQAKDYLSISFVLYYLAGVTLLRGDLTATRSYAEEGLTLAQKTSFHHGIAHSLEMLGRVLVVEGDLATARSHLTTSLTMLQERGKPLCCAHNLEGFARLALVEAQAQRAVCLLGAADAILTTSRQFLMATERVRHENTLAEARATLGEEAFAATWAAGRAMTLEQAVEYALQDTTNP